MLFRFFLFFAGFVFPVFAIGKDTQLPLAASKSFIDNSIFGRQPSSDVGILNSGESQIHAYDAFTENTPYTGIVYFAHLNGSNCFTKAGDETFDIGIVGAPFDLGVSYRPGARFGVRILSIFI